MSMSRGGIRRSIGVNHLDAANSTGECFEVLNSFVEAVTERRARRLNDLLVSKDSVPELLLALRRHAPELGAVHRGTALHRLAKAEDGATWLHSPGVVQLIQEASPRYLANAAWALGASALQHQPLAVVKESNVQNLSNTVRGSATPQAVDMPSYHMIAAEAICRIHHSSAQPPSNSVHRVAPPSVRLMQAAVKSALRGLHRLFTVCLDTKRVIPPTHAGGQPSWLSNTCRHWEGLLRRRRTSCIVETHRQDEPTAQDTSILMWCSATPFVKEADAEAVAGPTVKFLRLCRSNTARAATILSSADERPMGVLASACIRSIRGLDAQNLANSMRGCGGRVDMSERLYHITPRRSWQMQRGGSAEQPPCMRSQKQRQSSVQERFGLESQAPMLVWTMWKAGFRQGLWRLFEYWAEGSFEQVEPYGVFQMDSIWCKMEVALLGEPIPVRHQKVAKLLDFLEASSESFRARGEASGGEDFAKHKGQWLKVAGGDKADLLHAALQRPLRSGQAQDPHCK
ncbi:hypothetical protein AK812_SmicGene19832 [Symbiodinium microadriaticum]|uniref:Uncharacterized protein n=1 Tax=Symbiodinium microadriaticum TaxID=2951 RepID=A0A1Q9DRM5_SYMMI|nr:hypothetical protein AK812_SmicGene19832 [Symbiodinium microadriaticum]CAE7747646.1 unnamed protein product [Symbiodinium microadriaticum]